MKKIHIGSKINLVEVPENPNPEVYLTPEYHKILTNAIDNPIAEFDQSQVRLIYTLLFNDSDIAPIGLHDIPEGYTVDVKEEPIYHEIAADDLGWDINGEPIPRIRKTFVNIASLVPIKEERTPTASEALDYIRDKDSVSAYKEELIKKLEETRFPISEIATVVKVINLIKQP